MLELCWGLYGLEVWWGEYPAVYLSLDSRGRVFSPGLLESPEGPERQLGEPPSMLGLSLTRPHSPEGINREPEGFLLRQEGAS